ncbi:MAG: hypothetical protein LLF76_05445 [Planctomycetaceae bacterium]|nr:hypothetical protein [Planctomycetaceae bacterium]
MSKQKWIIGSIAFLFGGIAGLGVYSVQMRSWNQQIRDASGSSGHNQVIQEYLSMYEQWSGLSEDDKAENPWGQGQYGGPDIQKKLAEGQSDRLTAALPNFQQQTAHIPQELAEVMYGSDWRQQLEHYQQDCSRAEVILTASTFLLACGTIVALGGIFRWLFHIVRQRKSAPQDSTNQADPEPAASMAQIEEADCDTAVQESDPTLQRQPGPAIIHDKNSPGYFQARRKDRTEAEPAATGSDKPSLVQSLPAVHQRTSESPASDNYFGWALELEEKPELKKLMTTEQPLTRELSELTEEVSAIRHYAAQQQDQVRKLQDGYDWMIVRRFCLRIIRCVDNLEDRVGRLGPKEQVLSDHLQDVRDELVFALESSGIEQYEPDLNIPYKGLERYAEAVKERVPTTDPEKSGVIAEIARSGYQYLVNDDDVKIVRCAQVRLYEYGESR